MNKEQLIKLLASSDEQSDNEQILRAIIAQVTNDSSNKQIIDVEKHISILKESVEKYNQDYNFNIGDILQWKDGLKNKKRPQYGEPCVVVEILDNPISDNEAPIASPYYLEKLDIKLGLLADNGEFFTFHYDKNRFTLRK
jgi:Uma2 family endonuclease